MPLLCNAFYILVYLINVENIEDLVTLQKIVHVFQLGMAKDRMSIVNNFGMKRFLISPNTQICNPKTLMRALNKGIK